MIKWKTILQRAWLIDLVDVGDVVDAWACNKEPPLIPKKGRQVFVKLIVRRAAAAKAKTVEWKHTIHPLSWCSFQMKVPSPACILPYTAV
jgi:hypothetical protein